MFPSAHAQRSNALNGLFSGYGGPAFSLRFWDGWQWSSSSAERPACTLIVRNEHALHTLIEEPNEVTLGEAFIHNDLDVEADIFSVFSIGEYILKRPLSWRQKLLEGLARSLVGAGEVLRHGIRHSMIRDRASIAYHYDQPIDFYSPWLGETLVYSCAYFRSESDSLDRAQTQKLEHICRKLRLEQGEEFLDIGCGWGSLLLHAAGRHGANARGVTLSKEQAAVTRARIEAAGVGSRCAVELRDYRTLEGTGPSFDKIASVGMSEHVGLKNLPCYFRIVRDLLKPGGTFLNHAIARAPLSQVRKSSFIDRYVFPDGKLVTLTETIRAAESQGFEVRDAENLREHYKRTLRCWVDGLRAHHERLLRHVSEETYRIWLLYMAGSSAAFDRGEIAVYQVLLRRYQEKRNTLPLTRDDWYEPEIAREHETVLA
ncbi:MAG: class I SAM-dependent methyltransferase [Acidobacteriota bacterium]|nr:class I SAM-dependent methyltransferase [Acidobacteriota bacterium]